MFGNISYQQSNHTLCIMSQKKKNLHLIIITPKCTLSLTEWYFFISALKLISNIVYGQFTVYLYALSTWTELLQWLHTFPEI